MIRSMTGYGSAKGTVAGFAITIELRSVNNRYLDLGIKLPRGFLFAESEIKNYIKTTFNKRFPVVNWTFSLLWTVLKATRPGSV